jgi:hypothetical protein
MQIDQGDFRSKAFGGPSAIAKAREGPKMIVRMESTCTDRTNLGNTLTMNSPLP